jgi:predicted metal-dependent phosphoesterase TrpH
MTSDLRLDLHVHSDRSPDSRLTIEVIAARLRDAGLRGFALTDHNTIGGHRALREAAPKYPDLFFVAGVEVSTVEGHLLAYGVATAPPAHRPLEETIAWVREHGGEPVLAHPFRRVHGVGRVVAEGAGVRALEACNGQNSAAANRAAERLAHDRGLGVTGGSDAHTPGGVGQAYTTLSEVPASADELLEAIRRGRTGAAGASLDLTGRLRWSLRNAFLRVRRGFRAV